MTRFVLAALLALLPTSAFAGDLPTLGLDLDLELPTEQANVKDVQRKTAQAMNPPLQILPLAVGLPLAIAGMSVTATSPIAYGDGFALISPSMRSVGTSLMGGALGANILFNGLARTARLFGGGEWQKDIGVFVGGISAASAGLVLISVGTNHSLLLPDGERLVGSPGPVVAFLIPGSVSWTVGSLLLIIDAFKTAMDNESLLASAPSKAGPRFVGGWITPTLQGGVSGGVGFVW